jgi:hypothetical protein
MGPCGKHFEKGKRALPLVPPGELLWAQMAPANAASVRAVLAAGYPLIGAEGCSPELADRDRVNKRELARSVKMPSPRNATVTGHREAAPGTPQGPSPMKQRLRLESIG